MLKMLLPTTFPSAKSVCLRYAAITEAANSGKEVPKARMVNPMAASLTWNERAISTPPLTRSSDPPIRKINPIISNEV